MGKAKTKGEVSDSSILMVRRFVSDLEMKKASGKLTKDVYKETVKQAKRAVGSDWPDLAEAIENYDPKIR